MLAKVTVLCASFHFSRVRAMSHGLEAFLVID
jgi:hypothetical protein